MKKLLKIVTVVLALALCLFTPGMPIAVNGLLKIAPAGSSSYEFTAPTQDSSFFVTESLSNHDLSDWSQPSGNFIVAQQVTTETNGSFHEDYPYTTLPNDKIVGHSPYVIATTTRNMPANGCYSASDITLPANGCYRIEIEYCLKEQSVTNTTDTFAFGTFYLDDDHYLTLQGSSWNTKTFYVRTDVLESATISPKLYLGSETKKALGAIYFDKFTVTAINESRFNTDTTNIDSSCLVDYSRKDVEYVTEKTFSNNEFTGNTYTNAESTNAVIAANVPAHLGFNDEQSYFYTKDGSSNDTVMLLAANNSNATLTLSGYNFTPKPHEVYMFQFYSIATAAEDFSGFYLTITDDDTDNETAEQVTNISSYPYHNGWQLNTIFFVAGHDLDKSYTLSFNLTNSTSNTATGWVCIDDFKIYKVNGSYASDNASATGVHDTYDMNAQADTLDFANGYFELGTAADTVTITGSGYPYPLVANDWTTNNSANGIVNLDATLWNEAFGEGVDRPGKINNYSTNNNVYMMHNTTSARNILTSPAITTTAGETKTVSFDAYSKTTTQTRAWIITATTDDDGNLTNIIKLGEPLAIQTNGSWQHYTFNIIEDALAISRSYYLRFEMDAVGFTYIDNVCFDGKTQDSETYDVDLTKPLTMDGLWQATDDTVEFYVNLAQDGLILENIGGQKTVVQNTFGYSLTAEKYYEIVVSARGNNAYLGFNGYDGLLKVTTDETDASLTAEYRLYIHTDEATTTKFQITLGYIADKDKDDEVAEIADGNIFVNAITINEIEETEYEDAKTAASTDGSRALILSASEETEDEDTADNSSSANNSFFGENWWYLIPTLITAIAVLLAVGTFLFRKIKFEKHITKKNTSYARDMSIKNQRNKIVAQKAAKVDNITDGETQNN